MSRNGNGHSGISPGSSARPGAPVPAPDWEWAAERVAAEESSAEASYLEFVRVPSFSAGVYRLPKGTRDPQEPHAEDELYCVLRGKARFLRGTSSTPVGPGSLLYVPAHEPHRFLDVEEELVVIVVFAPAEAAQNPRARNAWAPLDVQR